jgi:16S rRNA (uracil1498-N3)-methyltransferase
MHRFFIDPTLLTPTTTTLTLPEKQAHQVRSVLRLVVGETLILLDNSGDELLCRLCKSERTGVEVELLERRPGRREPGVEVILCQGLLKSARFEWILEKGTELGVTTFIPTLCRRSMAGLEETGPAKVQRWLRILQEAAEQCGRSRIPTLSPIRPLIHTLDAIPGGALALMPWEEEQSRTLHTVLRAASTRKEEKPTVVVLFIGPEGGLMPEEVRLAQRYNVEVVTLGSRILRAETAALATIASVFYELEAEQSG